MKDMFYNYDHNINKKEYHHVPFYEDLHKDMTSYCGMQVITNIKGDFIGASALKNNPIKLFFQIHGDIDGCKNFCEKISDIRFEIIDATNDHKVLISKVPNFIAKEILIEVSAEENILKQDIYRMKLIATIDNEEYTLFAEQDAFLEIR